MVVLAEQRQVTQGEISRPHALAADAGQDRAVDTPESSRGDGGSADAKRLAGEFSGQRFRYVAFVEALVPLIERLCQAESVSGEVSGRVKEVESLRRKIEQKSYTDLGSVPDLAGVRIIAQDRIDVETVGHARDNETRSAFAESGRNDGPCDAQSRRHC